MSRRRPRDSMSHISEKADPNIWVETCISRLPLFTFNRSTPSHHAGRHKLVVLGVHPMWTARESDSSSASIMPHVQYSIWEVAA